MLRFCREFGIGRCDPPTGGWTQTATCLHLDLTVGAEPPADRQLLLEDGAESQALRPALMDLRVHEVRLILVAIWTCNIEKLAAQISVWKGRCNNLFRDCQRRNGSKSTRNHDADYPYSSSRRDYPHDSLISLLYLVSLQ